MLAIDLVMTPLTGYVATIIGIRITLLVAAAFCTMLTVATIFVSRLGLTKNQRNLDSQSWKTAADAFADS